MAHHSRARPLAIGVLAAAVTLTTPAAAIVGATRDAGSASVVMVLGRDGARAGFCSGVVIAPRAILTAAHCVHSAADTRVYFKDASGAPVLLDVARVARHPEYRSDAVAKRMRSVDLAIVGTAGDLPAPFSPAPIASATDAVGAKFTIAGFGVAREGAAQTAGVLRSAEVALRAPQSRLLLWLSGAAGACAGDSGGPVFDAGGVLVGIVAFAEGAGGNKCGALTQAVRVAPFQPWIEGDGGAVTEPGPANSPTRERCRVVSSRRTSRA